MSKQNTSITSEYTSQCTLLLLILVSFNRAWARNMYSMLAKKDQTNVTQKATFVT